MKKFVVAFATAAGVHMDDEKALEIAKSPNFQSAVADFLQVVETERRNSILSKRELQ